MPKAFNYYQQDSGVSVPAGQAVPTTFFFIGSDGLPSGSYIPTDLVAGVGFSLPILEDADLRPVTFNVNIYGDIISPAIERVTTSCGFYGDFFPAPLETGEYSFSFTGHFTGDNIDRQNLNVGFYGAESGAFKDSVTLTPNISGQQIATFHEIMDTNIGYYGDMTGHNNLKVNYLVDFFGKFTKKDKDNKNIDFLISTISYEPGGAKVFYNIDDTGNVDFLISKIIYRPPS